MEGRCRFVRFNRAIDVSDSCNSLQTAGEKKQYQYGNLMQSDLYSVYSLAVKTYQPGHVASTASTIHGSQLHVIPWRLPPPRGVFRSACPVWRSSCAGRAQFSSAPGTATWMVIKGCSARFWMVMVTRLSNVINWFVTLSLLLGFKRINRRNPDTRWMTMQC